MQMKSPSDAACIPLGEVMRRLDLTAQVEDEGVQAPPRVDNVESPRQRRHEQRNGQRAASLAAAQSPQPVRN